MKRALLRMGRAYDPHALVRDQTTPRQVYDHQAFSIVPGGAKVLVDHDDERVVGRVLELRRMEDLYAGERGWWWLALVEGDLPDWVTTRSGVSIGGKLLSRYEVGSVDVITRYLLEEISVLQRMHPRNVGAQVTFVRTADEPKPAAKQIRREPSQPRTPSLEQRQAQAAQEAAAFRGLIYRPGIGQVLGIR